MFTILFIAQDRKISLSLFSLPRRETFIATRATVATSYRQLPPPQPSPTQFPSLLPFERDAAVRRRRSWRHRPRNVALVAGCPCDEAHGRGQVFVQHAREVGLRHHPKAIVRQKTRRPRGHELSLRGIDNIHLNTILRCLVLYEV